MFYDRKIRYLNLYESGERIRGCGFAKLEAREKKLRFEATLKGLRDVSGAFPVFLIGAGREAALGELIIKDGNGTFLYNGSLEEGIGESGIPYQELGGIRIPISESREAACLWKEEAEKRSVEKDVHSLKPQERQAEYSGQTKALLKRNPEQETAGREGQERKVQERKVREEEGQEGIGQERKVWEEEGQEGIRQERKVREREGQEGIGQERKVWKREVQEEIGQERKVREEEGQEGIRQERKVWEREVQEGIRQGQEKSRVEESELMGESSDRNELGRIEWKENGSENTKSDKGVRRKEKVIRLQEDKWAQLCEIYPHITPFRDEREYLSISPADFVLLPAADYKAAHNSFLLHGYYNYHHLILTKVERRGETLFYLGVPGNYFEKEKQVAVMFGFESFECAEEPADYGDFGYYMMRVQI